jgi:hypothetical protein
MEAPRSLQAEISRVAVRLPPFWTERPAAWFAQAEAQFILAGISNELTKFYHVISQLDQRCVTEVEDIIASPPQQDPYSTLKTELVNRLCPLRLVEMGDRKPSQFLRHLRSLAPDIPDYLLRILWTNRLPANIQITLAGMPEVGLDAAALCADCIIEPASPSTIASFCQRPDNTDLWKSICDFSRQLANLEAAVNRFISKDLSTHSNDGQFNSRSSSSHSSPSRHDTTNTFCWYHRRYGDQAQRCSQPCTYIRSPSQHDESTTSCWYHRHFGAQAQNCIEPCAFRQQNKLAQQTLSVARVCTTATDRLFVTDSHSKQQFLINTGSDLSVFPRKLIPQWKERVNFDLRAVNDTTIRTYGWLTLRLNLGLRRDFTWRFVVADVTHPVIGADFIFHFGLLVDCRNKRLLDGTMSSSAPIRASRLAVAVYRSTANPVYPAHLNK